MQVRTGVSLSGPFSLPAFSLLAFLLGLLVATSPVHAFEMEWVLVDDPGNPPDDQVMTCCEEARFLTGYGSVPYVYWIGKFEVTVGQWVEFLNAVAADDTNGLYNENGNDRFMSRWIDRSGSPGSYTYAPVEGQANKPIGFLDFFDTLRFANWMSNGQPSGPQNADTTEDGAYTMTSRTEPSDVMRNPEANVFLTSEDEWYKAAYYDPNSGGYFNYPIGSNLLPLAGFPPGGPRSAAIANPLDCVDPPTNLGPCDSVDVGAYPEASSPFGTFNQAGNHLEWNESIYYDEAAQSNDRGFRGSWWKRGTGDAGSFISDNLAPDCQACRGVTFRVVTLPEPASTLGGGLALVALSLLSRSKRHGS